MNNTLILHGVTSRTMVLSCETTVLFVYNFPICTRHLEKLSVVYRQFSDAEIKETTINENLTGGSYRFLTPPNTLTVVIIIILRKFPFLSDFFSIDLAVIRSKDTNIRTKTD